jgi:DNA recombination protein RmuC
MLDVALFIVIALLLAGCAWLWAQRSAAAQHTGSLLDELEQRESQIEAYRDENSGLQTHIAVAAQQQKSLEEKQQTLQDMLGQARQQFKDTFDALAAQTLSKTSEQFIEQAKLLFQNEQQKADKQLENRQLQIGAMLKPVGEGIEKFAATLTAFEKSAKGDYGSLSQLVASLKQDQSQLRTETANLVTALRRPEVRGRWGEMQLRRVVELAGMIEHCDFSEQTTVASDAGGTLRPDMTIRLPSDRVIVVDAKTSLDGYLDALECTDEAARGDCLERHADQIEAKIRQLSRKDYAAQFDRAPDFVVLFIPGESFLQAAADRRPRIIESAMEQKVFIATPTTLISLLRAVAVGWKEERLAENAAKISGEAALLHERLCTLAAHIEKLGSSLGKAVEHYNSFIASVDTRVIPSVKKLEELHAGSSKKLPDDLPAIEITPRQSRTLPLLDPTT